MLEESSRFRGYQNPNALPALGYRVVAAITVSTSRYHRGRQGYRKGFPFIARTIIEIFQRFDARHYVEDLESEGVLDIGTATFTPDYPSYDPSIHKPEVLMGMWESNMSSPATGDISNSDRDRDTDLPVYYRSYMVYGQTSGERAGGGPQPRPPARSDSHPCGDRQDGIEDLFWQKYVDNSAVAAGRKNRRTRR